MPVPEPEPVPEMIPPVSPEDRRFDGPLLVLTFVLTLVPMAISWLTYDVESVKVLIFQCGTGLLLLMMGLTKGSYFGFGKGLDYSVMGYFTACFLSFLFATFDESGAEQLLVLTYQILFYLLVRTLDVRGKRFEWIATCWLGAAFLVSVVAFAQVVLVQEVRFGAPWGSRATGTFMQPTFLGAYLAVSLPLGLMRLLGSRSRRSLVFYGALCSVMLIALVLSLSRAGVLGVAVGLAVLVWLEQDRLRRFFRRLLPWFAAGGILVLGLLILRPPSQLDQARLRISGSRSVQERLAMWEGALEMIRRSPLLGFGPGNFVTCFLPFAPPYLQEIYSRENRRAAHAHSEPLHIAAETGLIGLGAWLLLVGWAARVLYQAARDAPSSQDRRQVNTQLAMLAAVLVNGSLGLDLRFTTSAMMFWFLLGQAASWQFPLDDTRAMRIRIEQMAARGDRVTLMPPDRRKAGRTLWEPRRRPLMVAAAIFLMWFPWDYFEADHKKMQGASFQFAGNSRAAEGFLVEATKLRPTDPVAHFLLGRNYVMQRDFANAERSYLDAMALDPFNPAILYNLARVYLRAGRPARARELLVSALRINPRFQLAIVELGRVRQLEHHLRVHGEQRTAGPSR